MTVGTQQNPLRKTIVPRPNCRGIIPEKVTVRTHAQNMAGTPE